MLKKVLTGIGMAAALTGTFLLGSLAIAPVFAQPTDTNPPPQATVQSVDDDATEAMVEGPDTDAVEEQVGDQNELDEQQPQYTGSILVDDALYEGMSEADEAAVLRGLAKISADEAGATATDANPGTTVVKTELDNENGVLVWSVELSNGMDVKVDAGNGQILYTDAGDLDGEDEAED